MASSAWRAPKPNKRTLKDPLAADLCAVLRKVPDLQVVKLTDGDVVAQPLKLSGMRWGFDAQAILTARGWDQSDRFNEARALLAAH